MIDFFDFSLGYMFYKESKYGAKGLDRKKECVNMINGHKNKMLNSKYDRTKFIGKGGECMGITMDTTKGHFLKILAMSGAIDLTAARTFFNDPKKQNNHISYLKKQGYIEKIRMRKKTYYYLTEEGKTLVLGCDSRSVWDCALYLSGNVTTNIMPITTLEGAMKVQRCLYQGRILASMYQARIPIFYHDKEDMYGNKERIREAFEVIDESGIPSEIVEKRQNKMGLEYKERVTKYAKKYGIYLEGSSREPKSIYYTSTEIKGSKNPALRQSRALGCLVTEVAPYVIYYMDNAVIKWKKTWEDNMQKWIGRTYEQKYRTRYPGDTAFVRGLYIIGNYDIINRIITEEKENKIMGNMTLQQLTYKKNHYAKLDEIIYYQDPIYMISIMNKIVQQYPVKNPAGKMTIDGKKAQFGILFNVEDMKLMNGGYVFCLESQAKLYENLGMSPIVIDSIIKEIDKEKDQKQSLL